MQIKYVAYYLFVTYHVFVTYLLIMVPSNKLAQQGESIS